MKRLGTLLFYCHHSRGMGHLVRSLALATELSERFRVVFLSGGKIPAEISLPKNVEFVQLLPVGYASTQNVIVSHDARYTLERALKLRQARIMKVFRRLRPAVLVIEYFPFGRLYLSCELLALLEAARNMKPKSPLTFCTLRDLVEDTSPRQQIMDDLACVLCNHLYDGVLFHSDPGFARLEETFQSRVPLKVPVHYTGFVVPASNHRRQVKDGQNRTNNSKGGSNKTKELRVLVTAGGGRAGGALVSAAVEAYAWHGLGPEVTMTIGAGLFLPREEWKKLKATVSGVKGLRLRRWLPDLESELREASASVSQCGYNTSLALLRSRVPALVVPFKTPTDQEQTYRARKLEKEAAVRQRERSRKKEKAR